jgi:ubiquinone/menaquinone biosynthesis C-methylase UbiE
VSVGGWFFASIYDRMTAAVEEAGVRERRRRLLADAAGRVLEIGAGTGANLPFYGPAVSALSLADPEPPMLTRLSRRLRDLSRTADVVVAPAERLPFESGQFDTVVSTLVLCTVRDQRQALGELRRVLKPGGRLLFLEHVRAEDPGLAAWQDRLNWLSRLVAHGCNCNRATLEAVTAAGFTVTSLERGTMEKAPPFVRPLIMGAAQAD